MPRITFVLLFAIGMALGAVACGEETPTEKMERQLDEAMDDLAGDGPLERLGEDLDEAIEDAGEAIEDAVEDTKKAVKNAGS